MSWNKYKLSEILTLIGGGTPKTTNPSYWGGNIPWLSVVDFNNDNRYVHTTEKTITEEGVENSSTKILPQGSLILSARWTVGALAQLAKPMAFNQSCYGIIAKEQTTNDFLYYLLKNVVEDLQAKGHGSVFNTITRDTFDTIEISLPPLEEQKRIADILGAFDDKIELLQKQNKTLEDMAKALFKSWFVDFDVVRAKQKGLPKADIMREYHLTDELYDLFPSSFADSPLGPIPSGWETSNLDSLCIRCQSGGTPSTKHAEYWENAVIDWFSTKELQDSFLLNSEKTISEEGLNNSSAKLFPKGTIIMAIYASPTVGRLGILTQEATFNQAAVGFIPKEDKISREYLFLMLKHRRDDLNNLANGAAQQNLSVGVVKAFNILIPNAALNTVYKRIVSPLFNKMEFNVKQIQTLTELRDTLLPRLISGKIRV